MKTASKPSRIKTAPIASRAKPKGRMPQRSETISGDEAKGVLTPIAAAQPKKSKRK